MSTPLAEEGLRQPALSVSCKSFKAIAHQPLLPAAVPQHSGLVVGFPQFAHLVVEPLQLAAGTTEQLRLWRPAGSHELLSKTRVKQISPQNSGSFACMEL